MIISHTTVVSSSQAPTTAIRNGSPLLERRIDEATTGLAASFAKQLHSIREDNAETIVKYVAAYEKRSQSIRSLQKGFDRVIMQILQT